MDGKQYQLMNNVIFKSEALWGGDCNAMSSWKMPSILIEHRIMQNYSFNCAKIKISRRTSSITHNKQQQLMPIWLFFRSRVYGAELHDFHIFNFIFLLYMRSILLEMEKSFLLLQSGKKKEPTQQESGPRHIYVYIGSVEEKEKRKKGEEEHHIFMWNKINFFIMQISSFNLHRYLCVLCICSILCCVVVCMY